MTGFIEIDRDHYLIEEIIGLCIDGTEIIVITRPNEQHSYSWNDPTEAENEYLKIKQRIEAHYLKLLHAN